MVQGVLCGRALLEHEGQRVRLETRRRMALDSWTRCMEQAGQAMHERGRLEGLLEASDETQASLAALQINAASALVSQVGICNARQALCMLPCREASYSKDHAVNGKFGCKGFGNLNPFFFQSRSNKQTELLFGKVLKILQESA